MQNHSAKTQGNFKRLAKLIGSLGVFLYSSATNTIRRLTGQKRVPICVILDYHAVTPECRVQFARQMDALIRWSTPITADHRQPFKSGERYAAVTFDDGFLCVIENAIPELAKRKIPAALFVVADWLGATPKWATFEDDYNTNEPLASADKLRDLPSDLITIGSHTLSHPWLPSLSAAQARVELHASRQKLGAIFGREIKLFSFPYGATNEHLVDLCREAGYQRVFTILPSLALVDPQEFVTGRVVVDPTDWPLEFHLKLLGAYRWLPRVFAWKRRFFPTPLPGPLPEQGRE